MNLNILRIDGNKSYTRDICPDFILRNGTETMKAYCLGIFLGDGSVSIYQNSKRKKLTITTVLDCIPESASDLECQKYCILTKRAFGTPCPMTKGDLRFNSSRVRLCRMNTQLLFEINNFSKSFFADNNLSQHKKSLALAIASDYSLLPKNYSHDIEIKSTLTSVALGANRSDKSRKLATTTDLVRIKDMLELLPKNAQQPLQLNKADFSINDLFNNTLIVNFLLRESHKAIVIGKKIGRTKLAEKIKTNHSLTSSLPNLRKLTKDQISRAVMRLKKSHPSMLQV
jgi:hypothetical protein